MRHWAFLLSLTALPAAAVERPNVVLVTLDTTRADRMGFLGSPRGLTPALDALARQGTVFEKAFAQAPITTVSIPTRRRSRSAPGSRRRPTTGRSRTSTRRWAR